MGTLTTLKRLLAIQICGGLLRSQTSRCCHLSTTSSTAEHGQLPNPLNLHHLTPLSQNKQAERTKRIANLPAAYTSPISTSDRSILSKPISKLVQDVHKDVLKPVDILRCYGKIAVRAHEKTNCLTEIMFPEAEKWVDEINVKGPLAGIPVSLKDSIAVKGFDVSVGYSCNVGKPYAEDGTLVKILKAAGCSICTRRICQHWPNEYHRSNPICQNQPPHYPPLLRILERCLGPLPQSS